VRYHLYFRWRILNNLLVRRVLKTALSDKQTPLRAVEVQEKRNALSHRLEAWHEIQAHYMPRTADLRTSNTSLLQPKLHPLYLPSSAPISMRQMDGGSLSGQEVHLRLAQAEDALSELRRLLRITTGLWQYKFKHVGPSQHSSTRTRAMIERFCMKVTCTAE
jgi:hypothetical protein